MEQTVQSKKCSDIQIGTKRNLKIQDEQSLILKRSKVDDKIAGFGMAKAGARRVTQPKYEVEGQSREECLKEYPAFKKWVEENLPSYHRKSQGVKWISVVRRNNNEINEIESTSNVCAVQSAFKGTKLVTTTTFKTLAEKYSLTKGKWMLFGETGHEIDRLWRAVADGVFRGTIPTHSAIVSATDDSHVICIPNKSFLNEADVFTLRDGIRKAGIQKTLLYKPNIYKHLGMDDQNKWGIDHILHRDESLFDLSYDREASRSAIAGINLKRNYSPILSISGPREKCHYPITLGTKAISPLIRHKGVVRLSIVFHDGNTTMRGVAFGAAARKFNRKLQIGSTYKLCNYKIQESTKKHSNTKYKISLRENTTIKTIENGYTEIPKMRGKKISELNKIYKNLMVSTLKVEITKIGELFKPKDKFLREVFVGDETGEMRILIWSYKKAEFRHSVGDHVKLRYMNLKFKDQQCFLHKTDNTRIVRC